MQNLPKERRLRGRERMGEIFASGSHAAVGTVLARALPCPDGQGRMAAVAGKKLGGAVRRNRMRRRLRAAFRMHRERLPEGWDYALVARKGLLEAAWQDLVRDMDTAVRKAVASFGRPPSRRPG
ncbi:MAG: ribonuclease P protein component [Planctomycetota bacterium]|jgi:ribonuclease P protein component|nr:ribonuclease P protein component [Planctomycetota bacterium]